MGILRRTTAVLTVGAVDFGSIKDADTGMAFVDRAPRCVTSTLQCSVAAAVRFNGTDESG